MTETLTTLTSPIVLRVNVPNHVPSQRPGETRGFAKLVIVREIKEEDFGATLKSREGINARIPRTDVNYASYLRLAERSSERQHPIGVLFDETATTCKLVRADNDVPTQLLDEESGGARVLFEGHDGVFRIRPDDPQSAHLRALLGEAIKQHLRVWFIVRKPDLALLDVLPAEGMREFQISFVVAPEHLVRIADEVLRARIRCSKALLREIRAVAKAFIDEADELRRGLREIQSSASIAQITSLSPAEMIEKAKRLRTLELPNKELQEKVRKVASSYLSVAEENQRLFQEFQEKYRRVLPTTS